MCLFLYSIHFDTYIYKLCREKTYRSFLFCALNKMPKAKKESLKYRWIQGERYFIFSHTSDKGFDIFQIKLSLLTPTDERREVIFPFFSEPFIFIILLRILFRQDSFYFKALQVRSFILNTRRKCSANEIEGTCTCITFMDESTVNSKIISFYLYKIE